MADPRKAPRPKRSRRPEALNDVQIMQLIQTGQISEQEGARRMNSLNQRIRQANDRGRTGAFKLGDRGI